MNFCPNCGKKIEQNWKVCGECGSRLEWLKEAEESKKKGHSDVCLQCGAHVEPDWKVCSSCGSRLTKRELVESPKIEATNSRRKSKKRLVVGLIVFVIVILALFFIFNMIESWGGCNRPFLQSNGEVCCLDKESENPCEIRDVPPSDEGDQVEFQTTLKPETTTLKQIDGSEVSSTTSTLTVTTTLTETTTSSKLLESCANKYGVSSDTVLYLYTQKCCDPIVSDRVRAVEKKGFSVKWIDAESLSANDKQLIGCFIKGDLYVPQFICPASKRGMILTDSAGMQIKIENFARECNENAYPETTTTVKSSAEVKCTVNADCGTTKSEYICLNGDVYLKKEIPVCRNPATPESNCITSITGLKTPADTCGKNEVCVPGESRCQYSEY